MTDTPNTAASAEALTGNQLEAIAHNLCSMHGFDPAWVAGQERFARAVITEYERARRSPPPVEAGGVEADEDEELPDSPLARVVFKHFVQVHMLNPDEAADATGSLVPEIEALTNPAPDPAGLVEVVNKLIAEHEDFDRAPDNARVWIGGWSTYSGQRDPSLVHAGDLRAALSAAKGQGADQHG